MLNDFGDEKVLSIFCNKSLNRHFNDVLPALPVIAIILAKVSSLFNLAKWQKEALPLVEDDHLYRLEKMTQRVIAAYEKAPTYLPLAPIMAKSSASSWSPSPVAGRRRNSFIADKAARSRL